MCTGTKADGPSAWRGARCEWRKTRAVSRHLFSRTENDISKEVYLGFIRFRVKCLRLRVQDLGVKLLGLGLMVYGVGSRIMPVDGAGGHCRARRPGV
jgi:hypothetical protein